MNANIGWKLQLRPQRRQHRLIRGGLFQLRALVVIAPLLLSACDRNQKAADAPDNTSTPTAATDATSGAIAAAASFYDDRHGVLYEAGFGGDCPLTGYQAANTAVAGDKPVLRIFPSRTISPSRTAYSIEVAPSFLPGSFSLLSEDQAHEWIDILNHAATATLPPAHALASADIRGTMQEIYFSMNVGSQDVQLKFVNGQGFFGIANAEELRQALKAAIKGLAALKATASSMTW
jgi:hypothetical protein